MKNLQRLAAPLQLLSNQLPRHTERKIKHWKTKIDVKNLSFDVQYDLFADKNK